MKIQYDPDFLKTLKKLDAKIRKSFKKRIEIFLKDPFDPRLDNHELNREYQGYRSIDINADYRVIYEEIYKGAEPIAYFFQIGTHEELYI
ncbi:hypothetical protein A2631_05355 [Candidatus Daviesbacteria bacterium RIFCSPHIGHO2_01_FULL_44_29]|uniref:Plasmid stabilization protein n=1 Tax=Candidatus Daviesbacteria bacterium RIFCSPHIGHO2_02_FULL_43_12 TaxID=1797776 RepID=A0A1F5KGU0_9BACT|nr:MAG: hypothetical protein A2631_05355 [Candidatus Daviesbacteria bacterium RIFCSPHIGHO2_01_FULL_44_29]OGE40142.1 MAG: hypothetical protein A3D25_05075 [Candidatus Daviesbacteria bacterium RIFCSPHIGHO2_02_FULL_43_12]OGE70176.1 MAG: hypothetical protein A3B55_00485 [Candidatus Daviesbacteria bacterium RIFCSPLOWO2_01_FULL_43_15]